ncbi:MAG: bifunctional phosphoribosylaminoimidazolecarboxamide formyltransferase/IMP cyclohydrolase, partial [Thermoproteota archaeon]
MTRRAIISVSDKRGVADLAKTLVQCGFEILSTGGTAKLLKSEGVAVKEISEVTGYPELLGGRVKTLHPAVYGGILADRSKPEHIMQLREYGMPEVEVVVVNLYPFQETVKRGGSLDEAIENVDVGGPALIRAAAKNFKDVAVVVDPGDYGRVISELKGSGRVSAKTREELAVKAFERTSDYDYHIANYLGKVLAEPPRLPSTLRLRREKLLDLRYGENPHQSAALYADEDVWPDSVLNARKLQGKALSYNNVIDLDSALGL